MKLGTQTASVMNHLYSRATIGQPRPAVGMGATILGWTDRHAATITKVTEFGGSKVWLYEIEVVDDNIKVIAGSAHDGSAEYEYTPGAGSPRLFAFAKKTQSWEAVTRNPDTGKLNKTRGSGLRIGERDHYYDPSF